MARGHWPKTVEVHGDAYIAYTCPENPGKALTLPVSIYIEGGCTCASSPFNDGRCYCPSAVPVAEWDCPECGKRHKSRIY